MATNPRLRRPARPSAPVRPRRGAEPLRPIDPRVPPTPPRRNWREEIVSLSGLNVIAGLWLIIAPWVLGYRGADPYWNDVVFGAIVAAFAFVRMSGAFRDAWLSVINAAIGVWVFIAAFTIDVSSTAAANDVIVGVIVFLLAIGSATATPSLRRPPMA